MPGNCQQILQKKFTPLQREWVFLKFSTIGASSTSEILRFCTVFSTILFSYSTIQSSALLWAEIIEMIWSLLETLFQRPQLTQSLELLWLLLFIFNSRFLSSFSYFFLDPDYYQLTLLNLPHPLFWFFYYHVVSLVSISFGHEILLCNNFLLAFPSGYGSPYSCKCTVDNAICSIIHTWF